MPEIRTVRSETPLPSRRSAATTRVAEAMTTNIYTCKITDTCDRAAQIMAEHDCGCVPILDLAGHPIGLVTDRDICLTAHACKKLLSQIAVTTAASRRMYAVRTDDTLEQAHELMRRHHVRRLPVVDAGWNLIGILSISDLVRTLRPCGEPSLNDEGTARG